MFKIKLTKYSKLFLTTGFAFALAACGSSSNGTSITPVDPGNPPAAPENVQVVAGDNDADDVQNTISWTLDPAATSYTVYWDNAPGVTLNSSIVVPAAAGTRSVVHSGVDVLAGNNYYYKVRASSAGGDSALSNEIVATPQAAVTGNQLNDVAWNGVDTLVAVGDSGAIQSSPNGTTDAWVDRSVATVPESLTAVTWENVNSQFIIVGAGSTVLTGDGNNWVKEDLSNIAGARNLQGVAWLGNRYIAVGNNGTVLTSNVDGSSWILQDAGVNFGNTAFNAVATNNAIIVIIGGNGTILSSVDAVTWTEQAKPLNNDLNDITWDGNQFIVVGSNDTILTSPDGLTWTSHVPGTSNINFVAVTQWDSGLPPAPVLGTVGSSGTFVVNPASDPGSIIPTGTTRQLTGMTWVDDGVASPYFVMVGSDGTVLTSQYE
jgi:photosystem II stability/assembly factor-like uncharacterized protein